MASGKTLDLKALSKSLRWRAQPEWEPKERDRSLRGKARRKARKRANKLA